MPRTGSLAGVRGESGSSEWGPESGAAPGTAATVLCEGPEEGGAPPGGG